MKRKNNTGVIILFILSISLNVILIIQLTRKHSTDLQLKQTTAGNRIEVINNPIILEDPIDVQDLPRKINSWDLSEHGWTWLFKNKDTNHPLLYNNHDIIFAHLSPSRKKLGFFFYPEGHSLGEIVLAVLDIDKKIVNEIYRGSARTSSWEWKGDDAIIVKHSCGTECMFTYVINSSTGKKIDSYQVY